MRNKRQQTWEWMMGRLTDGHNGQERGEVEIAPGTLEHLEAVLDARCLKLPFLYHRAFAIDLDRHLRKIPSREMP
jgi:hypothetical protein